MPQPDRKTRLRSNAAQQPIRQSRDIFTRLVYTPFLFTRRRLRPLWVILHWLTAVLVVTNFAIGLLSLTTDTNTDEKLGALGVHIVLGIGILLLIMARFTLRMFVFKPAMRPTNANGQILLDRLTTYVHMLLYLGTALMSLLGLAIALPADLFSILSGKSGAALPVSFYVYPARSLHGVLSLVLLLLIGQHVLAAVYHQFIEWENYLGRMWFTKSKA